MKDFFNQHKVLIIGFLSAIFLPLQDLVNRGEISWQTGVTAFAVAATGYLARNLRGQWATISGILGTVVADYVAQSTSGKPVNVWQLVMTFVVLFLAASSSPAKSRGYEHTDTIVEAKAAGETLTPTLAPPKG